MEHIHFLKRTWAVIDIDALKSNYAAIKAHTRSKKIMAVVKADGYGHGDGMTALALERCGVDFFAVSNLDEALMLRKFSVSSDILILGFTPVECASILYRNRITQTVFSLDYARLLNDECLKKGITLDVHIKLDTGMGRIGIVDDSPNSVEDIVEIISLKGLNTEGIFSHLSSADCDDEASLAYTKAQIKRYTDMLKRLEEKSIHFSAVHLQNSAGLAFFNDLSFDYARAGIVLYGLAPSHMSLPFKLTPVMSLKSVVSLVKTVPANTSISYGRTFCSDREMRIATIPIGYADGYPRLLSNKADVLIRGKRAKIIGNICMDQLMVDVSDIEGVQPLDEVTLVGQDGDSRITFDELAEMTGTINYELVCLIGKRVPRVYRQDGETVRVLDYLDK